MPDGTKLKKAKLRGVVSHGMILAEDEVQAGAGHAGTMVLADDLRARHAAGRRAGDPRRRPRARDHAEPAGLPRRLRRRARGARRHGRRARPAAVGRRPRRRGPRHRARRHRGHRRASRPVPALHRPRLRGRHDRAVAAVAQGAPDGRRAAADQQRRRHHELRDAPHRASAARVRPGPHRRRAAQRPLGDRGRAGHDARRPDAHARHRGWASSRTPTARRRSPA